MDNKKFCFVLCANDERYLNECLSYIQQLEVPEGYSVDCISVTEAKSMTSGYNEAMASTDAKYKIYLHQDVFVVENKFLEHLLEIFRDQTIGMMGLVGTLKIPDVIIPWYGPRVGRIYTSNIVESGDSIMYGGDLSKLQEEYNGVIDVQGLDGLLMATQYDLLWREDLFDGWDFYDLSQGQEFIRAGYRVVVPEMDHSWVIHDDGFLNLENYYKYREIFKREYMQ